MSYGETVEFKDFLWIINLENRVFAVIKRVMISPSDGKQFFTGSSFSLRKTSVFLCMLIWRHERLVLHEMCIRSSLIASSFWMQEVRESKNTISRQSFNYRVVKYVYKATQSRFPFLAFVYTRTRHVLIVSTPKIAKRTSHTLKLNVLTSYYNILQKGCPYSNAGIIQIKRKFTQQKTSFNWQVANP